MKNIECDSLLDGTNLIVKMKRHHQLDTKILLKSTILDANKGARFMTMDIKDCFLMTSLPIGKQEYMQIHSQYFDQHLQKLYNLYRKIDKDGYVYCNIQLGMYGLMQAAILAYKLIKERLHPAGYYPIKESNRLWQHKTRKRIFALCVDDFGVNSLIKTMHYM